MSIPSFSSRFIAIFTQNGLARFCQPAIVSAFEAFTEALLETNAHTNLTAIRNVPDIIAKHYADCLLAEPLYPQGASVLDLGCGGGFPSIPLGIVRPDLRITALDSTQKKIAFVQQACRTLQLTHLHPLCARAEDASLRRLHGTFDVATSRAMARMRVLCEMALPFVKTGGRLVALKGAQGPEELQEAQTALSVLGATAQEDQTTCLWVGAQAETRHVLTAYKTKPTPPQYPRPYANILKKPL